MSGLVKGCRSFMPVEHTVRDHADKLGEEK